MRTDVIKKVRFFIYWTRVINVLLHMDIFQNCDLKCWKKLFYLPHFYFTCLIFIFHTSLKLYEWNTIFQDATNLGILQSKDWLVYMYVILNNTQRALDRHIREFRVSPSLLQVRHVLALPQRPRLAMCLEDRKKRETPTRKEATGGVANEGFSLSIQEPSQQRL